MGIKMTLTFENETMETLRRKAKEEGFLRPSVLVRYLLLRGLREDMQAEIDEDQRALRVLVNNYREIKEYVDEKQLGDINTFAAFSMKQYMTRYPLKTALKKQGGETIGN
jgi:formylmethanofuran dehydrogenase subunit A